MTIKQFEYKPLAHFSYAIISNDEMAVIDPERNPQQYYDFAQKNDAKIVAVIETHPHADFVSSHLEIHNTTGATIYNSEKLGADYPHQSFDEGDIISLGSIKLKALNTPGHSADSITVVATDGTDTALFTGDTLFIGDVGRPDLRENVGNIQSKREELAGMMYETMTTKFNDLPDESLVYPAHGAGSLCGKGMGDANSSTLGDERKNNWAFNENDKTKFMSILMDGQPFIPAYFSYDVELNKIGAPEVEGSVSKIPFQEHGSAEGLLIDIRDEADFKKNHVEGSINIMAISDNAKFETWLGTIVKPDETFSLVIDTKDNKNKLLHRISKIGYEQQLKQIVTLPESANANSDELNLDHFKGNPEAYTIVDIRNVSEVEEGKFFDMALSFPLNKLRENSSKIPINKPIVVHCAGGYRSAAGSSILECELDNVIIYDLSTDVNQFKN
ncbi:MAG: rhodanese-like domain-containing protein [Bacteroidota bacterium]